MAESKSSEAGLFLMVDMPADEEIPSNPIELLFGDYYYAGAYADGEENYWSHLYMTAAEGEVMMGKDFSRDRKIVLYFYAATDGDFEVNVDDAGLSKECDGSDFGKYDFYNGTSMAAPAVTGTVALLASELRDADAATLANAVMPYVDESPELQGKAVSRRIAGSQQSNTACAKDRTGKGVCGQETDNDLRRISWQRFIGQGHYI